MLFFDHELQEEYSKEDVVLRLLKTACQPGDDKFTSHRWLVDSLPKRMISYHMYGDLLNNKGEYKKVLDVGGGYTALSRLLIESYDYTLLDIMTHDDHQVLLNMERSLGKRFWENADWYQFDPGGGYDLIVANDLFPNVDQRLDHFLEKYLPLCREMRISLTYYNSPRWYRVKRTDADEVFHMMAWNGDDVSRVLQKYVHRISEPRLELFREDGPSLFANKRQVCLVTFRGG
jgi:hypothetical protein